MTNKTENLTRAERIAIRVLLNSNYGYNNISSEYFDKRMQELDEEIALIRNSDTGRLLRLALIDGVEQERSKLKHQMQKSFQSKFDTTENKRGD